MKILVTGAAGFIGMHTSLRLLKQGHEVVGLDNLNAYYDVRLKDYRLQQLQPFANFRFVKMDLADRESIEALFRYDWLDFVIYLKSFYMARHLFWIIDSSRTNFSEALLVVSICRIRVKKQFFKFLYR
ncbi:NAD-dependent epimerase/dehydratase family protein [Thalassolituus pacificus]|uniref:UDP-glucose 4-epimerase n=1 Tax=Thalassolituus pacificus TaxID=2975440 RepID=A0A9X2WGR0_9GAMM|nr:NAD-dependent epimerase/dehydratase family protein [Thalassolituus pacificus]MCT7360099.1 GDP-mannose 4,6-dehydratase [Thalassolituus pacificus]